jgi:uncharacterized protein DUF4953/uncharacterized protein DUF5117
MKPPSPHSFLYNHSARPAFRLFALLLAVLVLTLSAAADEDAQRPGRRRNAASPTPAAAAGEESKKEPEKKEPEKEKSIDETVKGYEKLTGLFTFYRQKKGSKDALMLEVPEERLGQRLMLQITASTGTGDTAAGIYHGQPIRDLLVELQKVDDSKILVLQPNIDYRAPGDAPTRRTLERTYPATVLESFEIKARQPERKSLLVDVSDLFKADIADLGMRLDRAGYSLDRGSSYIDQLKVLPENVIVRTVYQVNRKAGPPGGPAARPRAPGATGPRSFPFALSYDLYALPKTSYRPRIGDTRVGYFSVSHEDASDASKRDKTVNYILRWNLEKADSAAPLSPPKQPIVFWIDNAVPEKYRSAVREGLLMWNPAFERIGIKDAIVVKQMPDDADWDIADVRYNVVRWTTGMPFAVALFRANPLTGEILNAAINFDAGFATSGAAYYQTIVDPTKQPEPETGAEEDPTHLCTYGVESAREAYVGELAFEALQTPNAPFDREAYIHDYIRQVIAHELGHNLGLRHNFTASTECAFDQLKNAAWVKQHGVTASVMDYNPPNLAAIRQKDVDYYSPVVGDYDLWAIEYGYRPIPVASPAEEQPELARIAAQCNWPGHAFQSDGMADQFDPMVARFDLGKDPLDWTARSFALSRHLLFTLGARKPKAGESYFEFTRDFNALVSQYLRAASYTSRFVGGLTVSSNYRGDAAERPPLLPVAGEKQQRALRLLNLYVFAENAFAFPRAYFTMLTPDPNEPGNQPGAEEREFPLYSSFASFQRGMLQRLFAADTLTRLANNEFRAPNPTEALTQATLFRTVGDAIWSELRTGKEVSALRRSLQIDHLNLLIDAAVQRSPELPADAITLSWEQLRLLKSRLTAALPRAHGEYGPTHLREALSRIDRAMQARPVAQP